MTNTKKTPIAAAMTDEARTEIGGWVKGFKRAERATGKLVDYLVEHGFLPGHFYSPTAGQNKALALCTPEEYAWIKDSIASGLSAREQKLRNTPSKELKTQDLKDEKLAIIRYIGARTTDLRKGVEAAMTAQAAGRSVGRKRMIQQVIIEDVGKLAQKLRDFSPTDKDNGGGMDFPGLIEILDSAVKLAKG